MTVAVDRPYLLALPEHDEPGSPRPVVFNFHGWGGNKERHEFNTSMAAKGTARGYVVVTPEALGEPRRWNWSSDPEGPDDFGFFRVVLAEVSARCRIDPARVYAAGHSNGSGFAAVVSCKEPFPLAAVAMVGGTAPALLPPGPVGPSIVAVHGTADATVPYHGCANGRSRLTDVASWAAHHGCAEPPDRDEPFPGVERLRWSGGVGGREVVFYTVVGGSHSWPGGVGAALGPNSEAGRTFPATNVVLDFFDDHRLPGA